MKHEVKSLPPPEAALPKARHIYANRNLRFSSIKMVGFDMDWTLVHYRARQINELAFRLTAERLVSKRGYPRAVTSLPYEDSWMIRGLVIDKRNGNILKMDRFGFVRRATHGFKALCWENIFQLYRQRKVRLDDARFSSVDTPFSIPEAHLYAALVDFLDARKNETDYSQLYDDVRSCMDEIHRDNTLKSVVRADPGRFIEKESNTALALHRFRSTGRRLFLLTNSAWDYADAVMTHVLGEGYAGYAGWRNFFDVVVVDAQKPKFFTGTEQFRELDDHGGPLRAAPEEFRRGVVCGGGNLGEFERMSSEKGESVLYIGDNIYGDILRSKKSSLWRTVLLIPELEDEISKMEENRDLIEKMRSLDDRREQLDSEFSLRRQLHCLHERERSGAAANGGAGRAEFEALKTTCKAVVQELTAARRQLDSKFNPVWGMLLKEGNEKSRFGDQVEDYACLYTSRVSNFLAYSPGHYFRAPGDLMAHER